MNAANDSTRAYYWRVNGRNDALQGRESLAALLEATGDYVAADNYRAGYAETLAEICR